jgi:D-tyrosyl-tRNA(Tyr) deacylase
MRAVIQRVSQASVSVEGREIASIGQGLLAFVSFAAEDQQADLDYMASKIVDLRIFGDAEGKMNLSIRDVGGAVLLVPNFTIHADCRRGRRPSFTEAAPPQIASELFSRFVGLASQLGVRVQSGEFGAHMHVSLTNDGPVTIILDSRLQRPG